MVLGLLQVTGLASALSGESIRYPLPVAIGVGVACVLAASFIAFHRVRKERDEARGYGPESLKALAIEGERLYERGERNSFTSAEQWRSEIVQWENRVSKTLRREYSAAESGEFEGMDSSSIDDPDDPDHLLHHPKAERGMWQRHYRLENQLRYLTKLL